MVQLSGPVTCSVLTYCSSGCSLWYQSTVLVPIHKTESGVIEEEEESPEQFRSIAATTDCGLVPAEIQKRYPDSSLFLLLSAFKLSLRQAVSHFWIEECL